MKFKKLKRHVPFLPRKMVVEPGIQVHLPSLFLEIISPLYHNTTLLVFPELEVNLLQQNLLNWGKDWNLKEVSLGNNNKGVVSFSSATSFATIASNFPQWAMHRSTSCTKAFAT